MIRLAMILLALATVAWLAFLAALGGGAPTPLRTVSLRQPNRAVEGDSPPAQPFIEAPERLSCSAARCHGAAPGETTPAWNSAFAVWITSDPHALAHAVLASQRSERMVRLLGETASVGSAEYQSFLESRCASCHAPGGMDFVLDIEQVTVNASEVDLSAGVSCEACHGDPHPWYSEHRTAAWWTLTAEEKAGKGLLNTEEPVERMKICAACHVGSPGRDVNHDLIAAGHPRLNFDYFAYWRALPKHWDDDEEQRRSRMHLEFASGAPANEVNALLQRLGRQETALATLRLLHDRTQHQPWPEFAAYECAACHHNLGVAENAAAEPPAAQDLFPPRRLGVWDFSTARELHAELQEAAAGDSAPDEVSQILVDLSLEMNLLLPDATKVQGLTRQVLTLLKNTPD